MRYSRATTTTTEMVVVSDVPPVTKEAIAAIARMVVNETITPLATKAASKIGQRQSPGGV